MSLKAGGEGLNLQEANRIFILEVPRSCSASTLNESFVFGPNHPFLHPRGRGRHTHPVRSTRVHHHHPATRRGRRRRAEATACQGEWAAVARRGDGVLTRAGGGGAPRRRRAKESGRSRSPRDAAAAPDPAHARVVAFSSLSHPHEPWCRRARGPLVHDARPRSSPTPMRWLRRPHFNRSMRTARTIP